MLRSLFTWLKLKSKPLPAKQNEPLQPITQHTTASVTAQVVEFVPTKRITFLYSKPSRKINRVFLHCSASDNPAHDNPATIKEWHLKRKFSDIGYHFFIDRKGVIHTGRNIETTPAAQSGHNTNTIAICVSGLASFTPESLYACKLLCQSIDLAHGKGVLTFHGHKEVAAKECPVFDYHKEIGINRKTHRLS